MSVRPFRESGGCLLMLSALVSTACSAPAGPVASEDYSLQGEYLGRVATRDGDREFGAQVIAEGKGRFQIVSYGGGLPGAGWDGHTKHSATGRLNDGVVDFAFGQRTARLHNSEIEILGPGGQSLGRLRRVDRKSPTLELPPPPNATVLFDGSGADAFEGGELTPDGFLRPEVLSRERFHNVRVHLEFRTPFMPEARGQQRGNSGVYLQGRYEVQILDSFGLTGEDNECGAIYGVRRPDLNMAFPPGTWQTYDIEFTAPRFDAAGQKTVDARMTVRHNGVVVHNNVAVPRATRAAKLAEGPEPGPLYLQDHGNPVEFRNIWIVKRAARAGDNE